MCTYYDSPSCGSFKDQTKTLIYYPSFFSMVIHIKTIYDVFHNGSVIYLEIINRENKDDENCSISCIKHGFQC
jgi:hypothetical protein